MNAAVQRLQTKYPWLPKSYHSFLSKSNGAEGDLGIEPGWVVVWSAEDALISSDEYQLSEYLPGYFAFGGNGGGELFVFPIGETSGECPVFMVPAVGMAIKELQQIAQSFFAFESQIGVELD
jgi:hypothetical protein